METFRVEDLAKLDIHRNGKLFTTGDPVVDTAKKITVEGILKKVELKKPLMYYFNFLSWFYYDVHLTLTNKNGDEIKVTDFPFGIFYPGKLKRKLKKEIGNQIKLDGEFNPHRGTWLVKEGYLKTL